MKDFNLSVAERDGRSTPLRLSIAQVLLAGYTGRNRDKVLEHVRELEELGVAPPPRIPMVYEVDADLVTTANDISVNADQTSGEVEFYLASTPHGLVVGLGSDHTDREQEAIDVAYSKTLCAKPISTTVWRVHDLEDHWDQLQIRAWVTESGQRRIYQDGTLESFLRVPDLQDELARAGYRELDGRLIFSGTVPTVSGFVYGERFEAELHDPVLGRALRCDYEIRVPGTTAVR